MSRLFSSFIFAIASSLVALPFAQPANANTSSCATVAQGISCTGLLGIPEDVFLETFTLSGASTIDVQTYGFGGGTNAAGTVIPAGGFDSLVALFSGPASNANILMSAGNPVASADSLTLFSPGCPPAGTVTVGSVPDNCGDNQLTADLLSGTYTLLLTDANFLPIPVNPGIVGPANLTDTTSNNYGSSTGTGAYTDLTGGVFETCADLFDCNTDTGNFAVDILSSSPGALSTSQVPEPTGIALLPLALLALAVGLRRLNRPNFCATQITPGESQ